MHSNWHVSLHLFSLKNKRPLSKHRHSAETSHSMQTFCEDWTVPKYTDTLFSPGPGTTKVLHLLCDYSSAPSAPCGCSAAQKEIYDAPPSYCWDTMQILEEKSELSWNREEKKKKIGKSCSSGTETEWSKTKEMIWNRRTNGWNQRGGEWGDNKNHSEKRKRATERFILVVVWLGTSAEERR